MLQITGWLLFVLIRFALYFVEAAALLFTAKAALSAPRTAQTNWRAFERRFDALARKRALAVVLIALGTLALRAALLPVIPIRAPSVTDEFSYLLAAGTFASGRLTNPPHPMWQHLQSIHILQQPTYASMYHVAQGLILAAGKVLTGSEWWGVCFSVALMCGLICWMLQGWLPPKWALLGGVIASLRLGIFSYWMNSYWGGAAAAIGGLLVLGAWPRLLRRTRLRYAVLMALGVAILANSRPYEGCVLSLAVAVMLALRIARKPCREIRAFAVRAVVPVLLILTVTGAAMAWYCRSITGNPFRHPYQVNRDRYAAAQIFLWERPHAIPSYPDQAMRNFYVNWELGQFQAAKTLPGLLRNCLEKAGVFWLFFLGPALTVPLLFLPRIARDRRVRPLVIVGGITALGLGLNSWFYPHYAAPLTGIVYALVIQGMRHLRVWRYRGAPSGLRLQRMILAIALALAVCRVGLQPWKFYLPTDWPMTWYQTRPGNVDRAAILATLTRQPGRQLAIVRYGPDHDPVSDWVYNEPSIDAAHVVWARDMGAANCELINYFADRRVWLVEPEAHPPELSPYPAAPLASKTLSGNQCANE